MDDSDLKTYPTLAEIVRRCHPGTPSRLSSKKDGGERRHARAILVLEEPVHPPVLIGAGRYRGCGACRPMDQT